MGAATSAFRFSEVPKAWFSGYPLLTSATSPEMEMEVVSVSYRVYQVGADPSASADVIEEYQPSKGGMDSLAMRRALRSLHRANASNAKRRQAVIVERTQHLLWFAIRTKTVTLRYHEIPASLLFLR